MILYVTRGKGVKSPENVADVLYESPHNPNPYKKEEGKRNRGTERPKFEGYREKPSRYKVAPSGTLGLGDWRMDANETDKVGMQISA